MGKLEGWITLALMVAIFVFAAGCAGHAQDPAATGNQDALEKISTPVEGSDTGTVHQADGLRFDLIKADAWIDTGVRPGTEHVLTYTSSDLGDGALVTWETSRGFFIDTNGEHVKTMVTNPSTNVAWSAPEASGPDDIKVRASGPLGQDVEGVTLDVNDNSELPRTEQPYFTSLIMDDGFGGDIEVAAGELLVSFGSEAPVRGCSAVLDAMQMDPIALVDPDNSVYRVRVSDEMDLTEARDKLSSSPGVAYAEYNYINYLTSSTPNDTYWGDKWDLDVMHALDAWDIEHGSNDVIVAVIDTGVDRDHPDLSSRVIDGADFVTGGDGLGGEVSGDGIDNNFNGWTDENVGHGTHVAGIIGARGYNGIGSVGVNLNVSLLPLRVFPVDGDGGASVSSISSAITYARTHGAKVINMSLGSSYYSSTMDSAVRSAISNGVTVVCAAGNSGVESIFYPAGYDGVVAVASIAQNLSKSSFSNYGTWVDICSPGSSIMSTYFNNMYATMSGTSMASPNVAGVAALLWAYKPGLTEPEIRDALINGADADIYSHNPSYSGKLGHGVADAYGSLIYMDPPFTDMIDGGGGGIDDAVKGDHVDIGRTRQSSRRD